MTVNLGRSGNVTYVVNNIFLAARLLLEQWPMDGGAAHIAARVTCIAALEGGDAENARVAFEAAAREAGVLRE